VTEDNRRREPGTREKVSKGGDGGKGGEMTQTLYEHMNKRKN
jgi:hypothetical protein